MIRNYSDHAANERTFLAWVRTSISIMAFGFLVEKFDLFLEIAAPAMAGRRLSLPGEKFGNFAGLSLIIIGTIMVSVAAYRFITIARGIDSGDLESRPGYFINLVLAGLMILLGIAMFLYLSHAFVPA